MLGPVDWVGKPYTRVAVNDDVVGRVEWPIVEGRDEHF